MVDDMFDLSFTRHTLKPLIFMGCSFSWNSWVRYVTISYDNINTLYVFLV